MTALTDNQETIYELALLQFRPNVFAGEVLNIGVLAYSPDTHRMEYRVTDRYGRLKKIFPDLDGQAFRRLSRSIRRQCELAARLLEEDRLGLFRDTESRLGMLASRIIPDDSPNFLWGPLRYGVCQDLKLRVDEVYAEYVARMEGRDSRERVDAEALWNRAAEDPAVQRVLNTIDTPRKVETERYSYEFRGGWMNGKLQVVEPISLDYVNPSEMVEQAVSWNGRVFELSTNNDFGITILVSSRPDGDASAKYDDACEILKQIRQVREVIPIDEARELGRIVEEDLARAAG